MVRNSAGVLVPQPNAMESRIRKIVTMHDEDYSRVEKTNYDWKLPPRWQIKIENCHHIDDDDDDKTQLRFGNGDCDALPLVLPPVPGASWKIEIFNKDMQLNIYSPSYKSQVQHMKNIISQYAIYCDISFFLLCKVQARKLHLPLYSPSFISSYILQVTSYNVNIWRTLYYSIQCIVIYRSSSCARYKLENLTNMILLQWRW